MSAELEIPLLEGLLVLGGVGPDGKMWRADGVQEMMVAIAELGSPTHPRLVIIPTGNTITTPRGSVLVDVLEYKCGTLIKERVEQVTLPAELVHNVLVVAVDSVEDMNDYLFPEGTSLFVRLWQGWISCSVLRVCVQYLGGLGLAHRRRRCAAALLCSRMESRPASRPWKSVRRLTRPWSSRAPCPG
jgi:hypothetical protein